MRTGKAIRLAEASNWVGLEQLLQTDPSAAMETDDYGMLPIHWVSTETGVPIQLLHALLNAYPEGAATPNNAMMLPLHIALRAKAHVEWIKTLLEAYPEALNIATPSGHLPLDLAKISGMSATFKVLRAADRSCKPAEGTPAEEESISPTSLLRQLSAPIRNKSIHLFSSFRTSSDKEESSSLENDQARPSMLRQQSMPVSPFDNDDASTSEEEGFNHHEMSNMTSLSSSRFPHHSHPVSRAAPEWKNDIACYICRATFGVFRHRHHCRSCGKSICRDHSGGKVQVSKSSGPQRVCIVCYSAASTGTNQTEVMVTSETRNDTTCTEGRRQPDDNVLKEMQEMKYQVISLQRQVDSLLQTKMLMQHELLEQEDVQAKTMLLLTETMTRVSLLELQGESSDDEDDIY